MTRQSGVYSLLIKKVYIYSYVINFIFCTSRKTPIRTRFGYYDFGLNWIIILSGICFWLGFVISSWSYADSIPILPKSETKSVTKLYRKCLSIWSKQTKILHKLYKNKQKLRTNEQNCTRIWKQDSKSKYVESAYRFDKNK